MHTVAVLKNWEAEIEPIPTLLPGLKRLWFEAIEEAYNSKQTLAKRQSKRVKAFSRIKFPNLIGVAVDFDWKFTDGEDEGMEECLEHARLDKQPLLTRVVFEFARVVSTRRGRWDVIWKCDRIRGAT